MAGRLGVTPTALYRHVANRWELERLVGESMLADLRLAHGLRADTAVVVSNAVASLAFAMAAGQERRLAAAEHDSDGGFADEVRAATERFDADRALGPAVGDLPAFTEANFARLLLTVSVRGVIATLGNDHGEIDATTIVTGLLRQVDDVRPTR